ncbi:acyl-CoA-binding domain-containing protein 5 isoform X2 [Condylostylus longicornis]|uniref:acyl-CoA-binding domain-containing protein 5 isoform X2 n=1 Tax=Condylostylus longicornis TaxID=2530218 RepID=UPI00244E4DEB|nr:acyl-CoA-binding domain-containing protein 5 isoform X2 [Condylostylus longicornis]
MASIEEKFNAAVNVIKGLPKNGSYQPSSAMMLTFYSYFKQATQGPCSQKKPPFWDVIGRAKWDAWNALGSMSKERAMHLYVDELKKIIETMSFNENVAQFMGSIDELNNVNFNDLEIVAPEVMKKAKSHPNSPFASRGNSPQHGSPQNGFSNGFDSGDEDINESNSYINQNGRTVEQSDDEYIDTLEQLNENDGYVAQENHIMHQIFNIVQRMNTDLTNLNQRMSTLERNVTELRNLQANQKLKLHRKYPHWWPFRDISPLWFTMLILWPFVVRTLNGALQKRK